MCEFLASTLEIIAVFGLDSVLDGAGGGIINAQDRTLHQFDLSRRIPAQASAAFTASSSGSLSLAPCLDGRCLTPGIGRGDTSRHSKCRSGILLGGTGIDGGRGGGAVGIVVGGVGGIGLGQAVAGGRADGRYSSLVWVIEGSIEGALLMR